MLSVVPFCCRHSSSESWSPSQSASRERTPSSARRPRSDWYRKSTEGWWCMVDWLPLCLSVGTPSPQREVRGMEGQDRVQRKASHRCRWPLCVCVCDVAEMAGFSLFLSETSTRTSRATVRWWVYCLHDLLSASCILPPSLPQQSPAERVKAKLKLMLERSTSGADRTLYIVDHLFTESVLPSHRPCIREPETGPTHSSTHSLPAG